MQGVVREGIGDVEDAEGVVAVHGAVDLVVDSVDHGHVKLVPGEDLVGLVYEVLPFLQPLRSA